MTNWLSQSKDGTKSGWGRAVRWLPLIGSLFLCACGPSDSAKKEKTVTDSRLKTVQTARAELQPMERRIVVTGSFFPQEQSILSVKVPGRLEKIAVDMGSVVRQGDLLAQMEREDYELRVQQAEAALGQARALIGLSAKSDDDEFDLETTGSVREAKALLEAATKNRNRAHQLAQEKINSQTELESADAAYTVAVTRQQNAVEEMRQRHALVRQRRSEWNLAQKQLADARILAPFDGVVQERRAGLGEYLSAGTPLLTLAKVDPLRLRLEVPEREAAFVQPGQAVRISLGENKKSSFAAISRVSPALNESNRMLVVEADVPASPALRPGLFAQAEIIVSTNDPALLVPQSAVTTFVGLEKVFIVEKGLALEKNITSGRRNEKFVEVLAGICAGDVVVLNPAGLRSHQPVSEEADATAR